MANCVVCKRECSDAGDYKCTGGCGKVIHQRCVNNDVEGKKTRSGNNWKCAECRNKSTGSLSSGDTSVGVSKSFITNVIEEFKKEVFYELQEFRKEMGELSTSLKFMSDSLDTSNKLVAEIKSELKDLRKDNAELRSKNEQLENMVTDLQERMRNIEQYSRKNNVEVSGVPTTAGENVSSLVKDVGAALGVQVQESDVAVAHRVPSFKKGREPSLIIQFNNRAMRDHWISKYRGMRELTASMINKTFPSRRVYINDHLSPENKRFLARLKQKCRDIKYDFAWCRDGKFFARKAPGDIVHRINTYADIDKLR